MYTKFICEECDFVWNLEKEKQLIRTCPNCRNNNIRVIENNVTYLPGNNNYTGVESQQRLKALIDEYVVPWMLDIK